MLSNQRHILTIATGKEIYIKLAVNLARSFKWWHPNTDIQFHLVTDQEERVPAEVRKYINIKKITPGELGQGFSSKLHLDQLAPEGQTLFIDSDCLIFGDLSHLFEAFKGYPVSVIGGYIAEGEWFGDVAKICRDFNIHHLPKFNGGIYYIEKGPIATQLYEKARELEKKYDEIGFIRLRNRPNDEVLMALAMQLYNQVPIPDDGTIMSDPQACRGIYTLDIIKGKTLMTNPPYPSANHQSWYPFEKVSPLIVHFLGSYTQDFPYQLEVYRLKNALSGYKGIYIDSYSKLIIKWPQQLKKFLKNNLRILYRYFFGLRRIKKSERL